MKLILLATLAIGIGCDAIADIHYDPSSPQLSFAAEKVADALRGADADIHLTIETDEQNPEAFSIEKLNARTVNVIGTDAAGALYGALEIAELIRIGGLDAVMNDQQAPRLGMRGVKFNIPLDVRTPSYSDMGEAGQQTLPQVWDFSFWQAFIDEMASHRYNFLSLWNLHPFPSLVKVPEYPDIALDDVQRAVGLERKHYDGRGQNFDAPEILDQTETLLTLSIDEKIAFWRKVMRYGKERNVDIYFVTWNIFDYGTQGKYGIDDSIENPVTADYFRQSVKQLFLTYPDLKGIGLTAGENMHGASHQEKEDWAFKTYGLGVLDALEEQPERKITFLHRQHEAGASAIADTFQALLDHPRVDFIFSYKYAKAHAYSATRQPFYRSFAREIEARSDDLKTIWTMRNDSTYLFRWAAPSFMREFVQNIPKDLTRGYYFGSDGWIWGREFLRRDLAGSGQLELQTHWFQWMLWGRLAYNPDISDERFAALVGAHFPGVDSTKLMDAWQKACLVFPIVTGFHWGSLDYLWYPEAGIGVPNFAKTKTGFHDVNRFITLRTHPGSGYVSIPDYVEALQAQRPIDGKSPIAVAEELLNNADQAMNAAKTLNAGSDVELAETLKDIEAMAYLSRYYGYKIIGATHLHLYRESGDKAHQTQAVAALNSAAQAWQPYASGIMERFQHPMWLSRIRTGPVDYAEITQWVEDDIAIAQNDPGKN